MIRIYDLIQSLTKEERRNVTLFLNRTNANNDRKDVQLFDLVSKKDQHFEEKALFASLYGKQGDMNTFYRLKNRLGKEINKSLLQLYYDKDNYQRVLNLITLSKVFTGKEKFEISYNYLREAEKKAIKDGSYDLLDLIYSEYIKLSQEILEYNPIEYIEKRKANQKMLHAIREIDDMLAALIYRVRISQNYSRSNMQFMELFEKSINEFVLQPEFRNSSKLQLKVYHAISRILLQQRDYISLESYLKLTYRDFEERHFFNRDNHDTKLQMLTYLVNALFKNNKIGESLSATEELKKAMDEYGGLLYKKYLFYYYNSLVINYQVTDKTKAIEVLQEAKTLPEIQSLSFYTVFVYLNLAVLYFDTSHFKNARSNLAKLKISDTFAIMDEGFRLKVEIFELLTFYELGDIDLFDYQLQRIQKTFKNLLDESMYKRDVAFMNVLVALENDAPKGKQQAIQAFIDADVEKQDSDIIDYTDWLKGKIK